MHSNFSLFIIIKFFTPICSCDKSVSSLSFILVGAVSPFTHLQMFSSRSDCERWCSDVLRKVSHADLLLTYGGLSPIQSLILYLSNRLVRSCWEISQYVHRVPVSSNNSSHVFITCKESGFLRRGFLDLPGITRVSLPLTSN